MNNLKAVISIYDNISLFHEVVDGELGPATNLTMDNIKYMIRNAYKKRKDVELKWKGIIPENVLSFDAYSDSVLFYTKPDYRTMHFKEGNITGKWKQPFLLWRIKDRSLSVWAMKKKPRDEKEPLYQAPLMNVSLSGSVCTGTVSMPEANNTFDEFMDKTIETFYNSLFTHANADPLLRMPYDDFIINHEGDRDFKFAQYLVPINKTIEDIL